MCKTLAGRSTTYALPIILKSIDSVDNIALQTISLIATSVPPPIVNECLDIILQIICLFLAPPCNPETGLPVLICERNCKVFDDVVLPDFCSSIRVRVQALSATSSNPLFQDVVNAFSMFECTDPATYFSMNVTNPDSSNCTRLFSKALEGDYKISSYYKTIFL